MTNLLIKVFIKEHNNYDSYAVRTRYGTFASIMGILCNVLLCAIKGIVGLIFNSVAIIADALNNLSDAGNSIIALVGFTISGKPSDKQHPYGHARVEYVSCLIVAFFIMFLGLSLLKTSVLKIFNPEPVNTGILSISVLIISIITKLWMSRFYKKIGNKIDSDVLVANATDSLNDVISTSAVLLTTVIAFFTNINLDGYAGVAVSLFIAYSGITILRDTIDNLVGTMPDAELVETMINKLKSYDSVMGIHDLVVHSYGPKKYFATVHVEVSVYDDILVSHDMIDNIERDFANDLDINLVIHLDPVITDDEKSNELKTKVFDIIQNIDADISMHDFRMVKGETHSNIIFDVVMPDNLKMTEKSLVELITSEVSKIDDNLHTIITVDKNYVSKKY